MNINWVLRFQGNSAFELYARFCKARIVIFQFWIESYLVILLFSLFSRYLIYHGKNVSRGFERLYQLQSNYSLPWTMFAWALLNHLAVIVQVRVTLLMLFFILATSTVLVVGKFYSLISKNLPSILNQLYALWHISRILWSGGVHLRWVALCQSNSHTGT